MYRAESILENFWVRAGNTKQCYITIGDTGHAMEAMLFHRTWNAGDDEAAGGTIGKPLRVNGHAYKCLGKNHFFALSAVQVATGDLQEGLNKIAYTSNTQHHGIEILWPGPAIVVRHVSGGDSVSRPLFTPPGGHTFRGMLYPNPANNRLLLDLPPGLENGQFSIYDLEGRLAGSGRAAGNRIDTGQLQDGMYSLKYETSGQVFRALFLLLR